MRATATNSPNKTNDEKRWKTNEMVTCGKQNFYIVHTYLLFQCSIAQSHNRTMYSSISSNYFCASDLEYSTQPTHSMQMIVFFCWFHSAMRRINIFNYNHSKCIIYILQKSNECVHFFLCLVYFQTTETTQNIFDSTSL